MHVVLYPPTTSLQPSHQLNSCGLWSVAAPTRPCAHTARARETNWGPCQVTPVLPVESLEPAQTESHIPSHTTYAGCLSSRLGISEDRAAWLVSCWPSLVSHPLPLVHAAVRTVCAVFECTTPQAMEAMVKEQRLLLHTRPRDIRGQLRQLAAALGMEVAALRPVVRRAPSVLYEEPIAVQTRLAQVAQLLGAPLTRILQLLTQQQPLLLVASPDTIQEQLTAQSHLLGLSPAGVKALQLKHPHMLLLSPTALNAKLQQLKNVLGLSSRAAQDLVHAYPPLLRVSVTRIAQQALDLHSLLPQAHLASLAAQEPSLLYRPAANAKASLHQLQQLLRCSPADAAALAMRRPALLTKSPSAPTASFQALSPWQLSQEQKSELLTAHPVLLRLAPTEVHLRCRWLRRVMLHSALLHSQLRELRMPLLGVLLMHLPGTWSRLEFVGRRAAGRPLDVLWVVESGDQAFEAACPGHAAWRAWRQQQLVRVAVGTHTKWMAGAVDVSPARPLASSVLLTSGNLMQHQATVFFSCFRVWKRASLTAKPLPVCSELRHAP
ncbi:hypothetical protein V8C86DRAFT_24240 [Haematococcus lacustris]